MIKAECQGRVRARATKGKRPKAREGKLCPALDTNLSFPSPKFNLTSPTVVSFSRRARMHMQLLCNLRQMGGAPPLD